jgi:hypothetical protein
VAITESEQFDLETLREIIGMDIDSRLNVMDARIDTRLQSLEAKIVSFDVKHQNELHQLQMDMNHKFALVDFRFDAIDQNFHHVEDRFNSLESHVLTAIDASIADAMVTQMKWSVTTMLTIVALIVSAGVAAIKFL